jgi:hypothetical protein
LSNGGVLAANLNVNVVGVAELNLPLTRRPNDTLTIVGSLAASPRTRFYDDDCFVYKTKHATFDPFHRDLERSEREPFEAIDVEKGTYLVLRTSVLDSDGREATSIHNWPCAEFCYRVLGEGGAKADFEVKDHRLPSKEGRYKVYLDVFCPINMPRGDARGDFGEPTRLKLFDLWISESSDLGGGTDVHGTHSNQSDNDVPPSPR